MYFKLDKLHLVALLLGTYTVYQIINNLCFTMQNHQEEVTGVCTPI